MSDARRVCVYLTSNDEPVTGRPDTRTFLPAILCVCRSCSPPAPAARLHAQPSSTTVIYRTAIYFNMSSAIFRLGCIITEHSEQREGSAAPRSETGHREKTNRERRERESGASESTVYTARVHLNSITVSVATLLYVANRHAP